MGSPLCDEIIDNNKKYILADLLYIQFSKQCSYHNLLKNNITDIYVSQKIMYHIKEFFYLTKKRNRTKKIKCCFGKFTRKKMSD
jgi:hypothetical protein